MEDENETINDQELEQAQNEATNKKALKTAAKGAANFYGGPFGGKAVDAISSTGMGQKVLDRGSHIVTDLTKSNPLGRSFQNALNKVDDVGGIDLADKAVDSIGNPGSPSTPDAGGITPVGKTVDSIGMPGSPSTPDASGITPVGKAADTINDPQGQNLDQDQEYPNVFSPKNKTNDKLKDSLGSKDKTRKKQSLGTTASIIKKYHQITMLPTIIILVIFLILIVFIVSIPGNMLRLTDGEGGSPLYSAPEKSVVTNEENIAFLENYPTIRESNVLKYKSILDALGEEGITELREEITKNINLGGICTSQGVAGAAVGLINGLHVKKYHLPYYYGGHYLGPDYIDLNWGSSISTSSPTPKGEVFYSSGLDSIGFVHWAVTSAGINSDVLSPESYLSLGKVISAEESFSGTLLVENSSVAIVIDNAGDNIYIAESTTGGVQIKKQTLEEIKDKYTVINMNSYYLENCST